jgi:hypothetical protein
LRQNSGPYPDTATTFAAIRDWELLGTVQRLKREVTPEQKREVREELERQGRISLQAYEKSPSKDNLLSMLAIIRKRLFGTEPIENAEPVNIGKPLYQETLAAVKLPAMNRLQIDGLTYDGTCLLLSAVVYPPRSGERALPHSVKNERALLQLDPVKRTIKRIPGPPDSFTSLTMSEGKLIARGSDGLWLRDAGGSWRQAYRGKVDYFGPTDIGCRPALHGNLLVFKRPLEEEGERTRLFAITLSDLNTGHSEDLVNPRRDPPLSAFDDPKRKVLGFSWESDGRLKMGSAKVSRDTQLEATYDIALRKWTVLDRPQQDYPWHISPAYFWAKGVPWRDFGALLDLDIGNRTFSLKLQTPTPKRSHGIRTHSPYGNITMPIKFEQGTGPAEVPRQGNGHSPYFKFEGFAGGDWLLWSESNGALWVSPYADFIKHFEQLIFKNE